MSFMYDLANVNLPDPGLCEQVKTTGLRAGLRAAGAPPAAAPSSATPASGSSPRPNNTYRYCVRWTPVEMYAPTTYPPGKACVEVSQGYLKTMPGAPTARHFLVYDWCGPVKSGPNLNYITVVPITTTGTNNFVSRFVRPYQGRQMYSVSVQQVVSCWFVSLYDWNAGKWADYGSSCGTSTRVPASYGSNGWTIWESYRVAGGTSCPSIASIRASQITFYDPAVGSFIHQVPFTSYPSDYSRMYGAASCWASGAYKLIQPAPGDVANSWQAATPTLAP